MDQKAPAIQTVSNEMAHVPEGAPPLSKRPRLGVRDEDEALQNATTLAGVATKAKQEVRAHICSLQRDIVQAEGHLALLRREYERMCSEFRKVHGDDDVPPPLGSDEASVA